MEGYEVVTSDDAAIGHVVERKGDYLIVEHGLIRKSRHALPWSTAHVDEAEKKVRTSLSKELVETSPKLENGSLDEQAVARHYGLGADSRAPGTEGYGVTDPTDPTRSAEEDAGMEPAQQERVEAQKEMPRQEPEIADARRTQTDRPE